MKQPFILLCLLLASIGFAFAGGPVIPPSASAVSGLGTMAVVNSPVPIANGGTGATSAATGLAALGGASLNGSSTVDFLAQNLNVSGVATFTGFTKLGDAATGIKMKVLTGTTGANSGDTATVAHGLTGDKIVGITAKVAYGANLGVTPELGNFLLYEFSVFHDATNAYISTKTGNDTGVLNKPFTIMIWYVE